MTTEKGHNRDKYMNLKVTKNRSALSAECVRTLIVLKQQEHIIEKSLNTLIASMKTLSEISNNFQHEQIKLSDGRAKLFDSLKNTLYDIADELRFVKSTIQNISEIDVDKYRSKLESLWKKMDEFNKSNILETLIKEQNQIDIEIAEFSEQLYRYEKNKDNANYHSVHNRKSLKSNNKFLSDYEGVENFESLVAKTGHTQRWNDEDHLLFLKLRQKCKSIPALVNSLQNMCPDLSTESIINHEAWYRVYLDLREKQKHQIEEWRRTKRNQKQKQIEKKYQEAYSDNSDDITGSSDASKKQVEMSDKNCDRAIRVEIMKKSQIIDERRNEAKKESIRQWKMERENQRLLEEKELLEAMKLKKMEQDRQRQERTYRMKIELREYKKKKMMETQQNAKDKIRDRQRSDWRQSFQLFRQQDQNYIQKRRLLIQKKNSMNNRVLTNHSINIRSRFTGNMNRQNFLKSTKVWEQKCRFFDPTKKRDPQLTYIKDLPRLRTSYRRNMESF